MSCIEASSPIDIKQYSDILSCNGKCNLSYNYDTTNITCFNKRNYLLINLVNESSNVITYSTNTNANSSCNLQGGSYVINRIRIYRPSLHTYDSVHADAELIIEHTNNMGGNDLFICLPISNNSGTQPKASSQLNKIINFMGQVGNNTGEGGQISDLAFNLNDFIPNKGFYTYSATIPYMPCSNCVIFIVWDYNEASININDAKLEILKSLISTKYFTIKQNKIELGLAYNSNGASHSTNSEDTIYIDCQPTDNNGELITKETVDYSDESSISNTISSNPINDYLNSDFIKVIIGILLILIIYIILKKIFTKIGKIIPETIKDSS